MRTFTCAYCKKEFKTYHKKRTTCSKKCLAEYQKRTVIKKCGYCEKLISRRKSDFNNKMAFCDRSCQHNYEKVSRMKYPQLRDKDWCIRQYEKLSLIKIAEKLGCGETTVYKFFKLHDINLDRSKWISGNNHYDWKGGVTKLTVAIRASNRYRKWRKRVFENSDKVCIFCKNTNRLEVDHIKKFKFILSDNNIKTLQEAYLCKELWDVNNGRILCRYCNLQRL